MTPERRLLFPDSEDQRSVHLQSRDRSPSGGCQPNKGDTIPAEVLSPVVASGIEEGRVPAALRISRRLSGRLSERARHAREREVFNLCLAGCRDRHDMVDMEGRFLTFLRQPTVLAAPTCSLCHKAT
jgi:hypothetical protein